MSNRTHPSTLKREVSAWRAMRRRCLEPKHKDFPRYGGRGIKVCPQWLDSFDRFLADVGPAPSADHWLGRRDVAKGYTPDNVAWTLRTPQIRRRRCCLKVPINGRVMTLSEAARAVGMAQPKLWRRLQEYHRPLIEAVDPADLVRKNAVLVTHLGVTLPLRQWAALSGVPSRLLWSRLRAGWPAALALDPTRRTGGPALELLKAALAPAPDL